MAKSLNKVMLIGNLGKDPEVRYTAGGRAVASFSMATTDSWNDKDGNKQERTEWHKIVAWGKLGEICGEYLAKGRQVYIEGRLQTREWNDKEGNKRYTTEIVASDMLLIGSRGEGQEGRSSGGKGSYSKPARSGGASGGGDDDMPPPPDNGGPEDDIPF